MNWVRTRIGESAVLFAALLWGCIGIFTRSMLETGFTAVQIVAVRAFVTAVVMGVIILIKDPKLFKIRLKDIWMFFGTGILSFLFFNICYMSSIGENSLSVACILMYTSPIWVTTLAVPIFKEKLTFQKLAAFIICFGGCVMVCLSDSLKLTEIGLVFGLLSGLGYALYSIFGKIASAKYNTLTITFYTFLFASVGVLPLCDLPKLTVLLSSGTNVLWSVGVAVTCTILPYLLYTFGLSKTSAGKAAVIAILEPAVASVVGVLCFGENMGVLGLFGIAAVMVGLVYLETGNPFKRKH
ncbi:MAG: EamA family transporter [Clostridia bacterium]|nr:EamA family transporter [Clostridia bacterium]